jgi:hypothetical protein
MARNLTIVTRNNGEQYILQGYVVGTWYLIPFVPHWNRSSPPETELWKKYWEPHYAKKDTWIAIGDVDFSEWDITKEEYLAMKDESTKIHKEILAKYHASF